MTLSVVSLYVAVDCRIIENASAIVLWKYEAMYKEVGDRGVTHWVHRTRTLMHYYSQRLHVLETLSSSNTRLYILTCEY